MINNIVINIEGLTKTYDKFTAVDEISFTVNEGEVFALLGPNGAGKTTTVEIIECLKTPDKGKVEIFGIDLKDKKKQNDVKRKIGVMPQNFNAFDWLTVKENLDYFRDLYSSKISTDELINLVGLGEKMNSMYKTLSGGTKQRVGIAISLINEPELLFLDEPTAGLDPKARRETWNLIRKLKEQGKTIFLTTHYMEEAQELSDRILIIIEGKIVAGGSPNELIENYGGNKSVILKNCNKKILEDRGIKYEAGIENQIQIIFDNNEQLFNILSAVTDDPNVEIEIKKPNLDEAFLNLTGRRINAEGLAK
uniref:ABC transporter related protein (ABC-2.AB.A) n=1 Tax=uncultured marine thaumarchaeote KM3_54_F04 TaxID=1456191 RepID=A0A075HDV9_9ARCH|nr:ABC transporter related protein (ABC-2.AB.A) [uncultured marine thaumarchaeote KM3_54_F04]